MSWVAPERLPLAPETIARIYEVQTWFERSLNWEYPPDPGPWRQAECDDFNAAARDLYEVIANELGARFVVDFHQEPLKERPELDVHLQNNHWAVLRCRAVRHLNRDGRVVAANKHHNFTNTSHSR